MSEWQLWESCITAVETSTKVSSGPSLLMAAASDELNAETDLMVIFGFL